MFTLRTIALATLVMAGCSKSPAPSPSNEEAAAATPAPASAAAKTKVDPHAAIGKPEPRAAPHMAPTVGDFKATIDGKPTTFLRIPRGQNRAIAVPDRGVARVSIAAAEADAGWPHMRLVLEHLKLDAVDLPLTLPNEDAATKDVIVSARYQVNENRIYTADPGEGGEIRVTLESFEGNRLVGTFEGKLAPTAKGLGEPIPVSGEFSMGLGLRGVNPGPTPQGGDPSAAPANSHEQPASPMPAKQAEGTAKPDAEEPAAPSPAK